MSDEYGGPAAPHSEYKPGDELPYRGLSGRIIKGKILHVSDGPGGQLYTVENKEAGFPDLILASEVVEEPPP